MESQVSSRSSAELERDLRDDPAFATRGLELEDVLGIGGSAIVYRARDTRHGREVAIKVLRPEASLDRAAARFAQEVRVAASSGIRISCRSSIQGRYATDASSPSCQWPVAGRCGR